MHRTGGPGGCFGHSSGPLSTSTSPQPRAQNREQQKNVRIFEQQQKNVRIVEQQQKNVRIFDQLGLRSDHQKNVRFFPNRVKYANARKKRKGLNAREFPVWRWQLKP